MFVVVWKKYCGCCCCIRLLCLLVAVVVVELKKKRKKTSEGNKNHINLFLLALINLFFLYLVLLCLLVAVVGDELKKKDIKGVNDIVLWLSLFGRSINVVAVLGCCVC